MKYWKQVIIVTRWEFSRFFKPKNEVIGIIIMLIVSAVFYFGSKYALSDKSPEIEVFVHNDTDGALTEILKVDFAEINVPKTEDEIWRSREEQEKRFMATPKDWLKEDNPDLTYEEAENLLKENKELMDSTVNAEPKTNFQKLLDNNLTTNEESENG